MEGGVPRVRRVGRGQAASETAILYQILRDQKGYPIQGFWIDLEHCAVNGDQLRAFATLARAMGFSVVVRIRENRFACFKEIVGIGVDGIVVPSVSGPEDVDTAFTGLSPGGLVR